MYCCQISTAVPFANRIGMPVTIPLVVQKGNSVSSFLSSQGSCLQLPDTKDTEAWVYNGHDLKVLYT